MPPSETENLVSKFNSNIPQFNENLGYFCKSLRFVRGSAPKREMFMRFGLSLVYKSFCRGVSEDESERKFRKMIEESRRVSEKNER